MAAFGSSQNRIFPPRAVCSCGVWESVQKALYENDIVLLTCDETPFAIFLKFSGKIVYLIFRQNLLFPLFNQVAGLVCVSTVATGQGQTSTPWEKDISKPVPIGFQQYKQLKKEIVRRCLDAAKKLPGIDLKQHAKAMLVALKNAETVSFWAERTPPTPTGVDLDEISSKLVQEHTKFEWALERVKNAVVQIGENEEQFRRSDNPVRSLFPTDSGVNAPVYKSYLRVGKYFARHGATFRTAAEEWKKLVECVMAEESEDMGNTQSEIMIASQTIKCIASVPWNKVGRESICLFLLHLTTYYKEKMVADGNYNDAIKCIKGWFYEASPTEFLGLDVPLNRYDRSPLWRWRNRFQMAMECAKNICLSYVPYLLDLGVQRELFNESEQELRILNKVTQKCDEIMDFPPFHGDALPSLLVRVMEALANDMEECSIESHKMASLGEFCTKQHEAMVYSLSSEPGNQSSKQYTHNAILRINTHTKLLEELRLKSPIKAWLDNLGLSEDYSGKFMEIGVEDTIQLTLKPLDLFDFHTMEIGDGKDIEKIVAGMTTFLTDHCEHLMSQIDPPLLRETLKRDILPNVDSSSILPDPVLMYIFTIMQREYSGEEDDLDLLEATKTCGRWKRIIETLATSPFPPTMAKHLLSHLPSTRELNVLESHPDFTDGESYDRQKAHNGGEGEHGYAPNGATDAKAMYKGGTALHTAATVGNAEIVEALLEYDADPNMEDGLGRTPLHWAAFHGHLRTCRALLKAGAWVEVKDSNGKTPMQLAKQHNHLELISVMKAGAKLGNTDLVQARFP
eukprot:g506.t1